MLRSALGMAIAGYLENESIVEVILSPDGQLWIDRLSSRPIATGETLPAVDGGHIVRLVAHHVGAEVDDRWPRVSAELPITDARFEDLLPPALAALAFALRKPALGCVHARRLCRQGDRHGSWNEVEQNIEKVPCAAAARADLVLLSYPPNDYPESEQAGGSSDRGTAKQS